MKDKEGKYTANEIDQYLNSMNIIFYLAVCLPLLLFVLIFLKLQEKGGISPAFQSGDSVIHPILAFAVILFAYPGYAIYKNRIKRLMPEDGLRHKLQVFKDASIKKYLFIAFASCVANALLYYFEEQIYLMAFAILLILFSVSRPTVYRIKKDVILKADELSALTEYRKHV